MHSVETLRAFAARVRTAGFTLYSQQSYDAARDAEKNLDGRTHYADADTRLYFGSRILSARAECEGLIFGIIESTAVDHQKTRRGFRPVFFDIHGTVIYRPALDEMTATRAAAERKYRDFLAVTDAIAVTRDALLKVAKLARQQAADIESALSE